jgi:tubulin polyglutamylase TTLL5
MRDKEYQGLHELQRVNHFPGSTELTRKDRICVHFDRMARRFGSQFNFLPETYVLPRQVDEFLDHYQNSNHIWIVKPNASSQGKGIFLLKNLDDLPNGEGDISVVSRYIDNPYLIQGLKFDLRVYVLVTSFEPLRAYVYREGLARFASSPYSTDDAHLRDAYRHLTNYSINKKAENFVENQNPAQDNVGHKWSFSAFNRHLKACDVNVDLMWARINDLILKTLISVRPVIAAETRRATAHGSNCFELYGFDVLVDEDLKPWLIEVNLSPSMLAESPLDMQVKSAVLSDTFNLIGVANASWRTLATAKLRSQLLQMRHSMAMASQAAAAFKAGESLPAEPNMDERAVRLSELSERDLKMMAQALKEVNRCNNFIRLYPTANTVKRYAPLMRMPSPTASLLLQMLLGEDSVPSSNDMDDSTAAADPPKTAPAAKEKTKREPRIAEAGRSTDKPLTQPVKQEQTKSFEELVAGSGDSAVEQSKASKKEEEEEILDWSGFNSMVEHKPARTTMAVLVLKSLSTKASSQLLVIEYLTRIINICRSLRMDGRTKLAQSKAYRRLTAFRQQLSILVRTSAKASQLPWPPIDDIDSDFIDQLVGTCRAGVASVSRDLWAAASRLPEVPLSPEGSRNRLSLISQLPSSFVKSARGERVIGSIQGLSSGDLEFILQGPDCSPEFASLFGNSGRDAISPTHQGFDELERMIECCGVASGPLSELLNALSPEDRFKPNSLGVSPEKVPEKDSPAKLPSIFSGMPLMMHAAAACTTRQVPPRGPALENSAHARSASILARLANQHTDILPKPKPKLTTGGITKSLPTLPALSPARSRYHTPLASLRSKQLQKPLHPQSVNDFMHADIEF